MKDGKKIYEKLRKKYNLPKFDALVNEFEVNIENPDLVLHSIVDKILDKLFDVAKTIEGVIFVESGSSPSQFYETKMLENKEDAFELYKELMSIYWTGKKAEAESKEKEMSGFIKEAYGRWMKNLKSRFIKLCVLFEKEWKMAKLREKEVAGYHG